MDSRAHAPPRDAESLLPQCVASPVGRPASPGCGQPVTPLSGSAFTFSDVDLLESGGAKITLSPSHLRPQSRKSDKFRRCVLKREKSGVGEDRFWLYDERRHDFMLSARKIGAAFYISQYEEFPVCFDGTLADEDQAPQAVYCCVLRLDAKAKVYRLFNRSCEGCDSILAKHTCGPRTRINSDRQLLAEVRHAVEPVACGDSWTECNSAKVKIPNVYDDASRDVWCLRQMAPVQPAVPLRALSAPLKAARKVLRRSTDPGRVEEERKEEEPVRTSRMQVKQLELAQMVSPLKRLSKSSNQEEEKAEGMDDNVAEVEVEEQKEVGLREERKLVCGRKNGACLMKTRVPRYDVSSGTLRMKFYNQRVRQSSSKNMIFTLPFEDGDAVLSDKEGAILQFGKLGPGSYSLDFTFPLAPVQALGICLTLFNWQVPSKKK